MNQLQNHAAASAKPQTAAAPKQEPKVFYTIGDFHFRDDFYDITGCIY